MTTAAKSTADTEQKTESQTFLKTQPQSLQKTELQTFLSIKADIQTFTDQYAGLTISGIDDKIGLERVHAARLSVKAKRIEVEKRGKELREDAIKTQKIVLKAVKDLVGLLEPVETHLQEEETRIEQLKADERREELRKAEAKVQSRINWMAEHGLTPNLEIARNASDVDFKDYCELHETNLKVRLEQERQTKLAETAKKAAEDAARQKELDDLKAERERLQQDARRLADERRMYAEFARPESPPAVIAPNVTAPAVTAPNIVPPGAIAPQAARATAAQQVQHAQQVQRPPAAAPLAAGSPAAPAAPAPSAGRLKDVKTTLLAYAEKVKVASPGDCPECPDLMRKIKQILRQAGDDIEASVKAYFPGG